MNIIVRSLDDAGLYSSLSPNSSHEPKIFCVLADLLWYYFLFHGKNMIRQHLKMVDSTQLHARGLATTLPPDRWIIVTADEQTAGRGTHNRQWLSPPNSNLYVTFVIPFPRSESEKLFYTSQVAAIATARTLTALGFQPEVKWPNDVTIAGKKVGGILCENMTPDTSLPYSALLIGIGLNVTMDKATCDSLDQPVTSLTVEASQSFDKEEILQALFRELRHCIDQLLNSGFSPFQKELNSMLAFKEEKVCIETDGKLIHGTVRGIDDMRRLQLESRDTILLLANGRLRKVVE